MLFNVFMYAFDVYAEERGARWRSPFSKDGPALWQLARAPYPNVDNAFYQMPERWLEATGECFVLCIGVSWLVTAMFNPGGATPFALSLSLARHLSGQYPTQHCGLQQSLCWEPKRPSTAKKRLASGGF